MRSTRNSCQETRPAPFKYSLLEEGVWHSKKSVAWSSQRALAAGPCLMGCDMEIVVPVLQAYSLQPTCPESTQLCFQEVTITAESYF